MDGQDQPLPDEPNEIELALLRERHRRVMLEFHLQRVLHDLGNHMHAIELRTSFLSGQRHALGDAAELFDAIQQSAQAARSRIASIQQNAQSANRRIELLQQSGPDSEPPSESVSPGGALALAIALARRDSGKITVAPRVTSLPQVHCRRDSLALVILSLLDNAREAGASVFIDGQCDDERVVLMVSDDGPGLPPKTAIWKPFVSTKGEGHLGHGLPLAAQLLRLHGGTIHDGDHADAQGARGACFTITLRRAGTSGSASLTAKVQQ